MAGSHPPHGAVRSQILGRSGYRGYLRPILVEVLPTQLDLPFTKVSELGKSFVLIDELGLRRSRKPGSIDMSARDIDKLKTYVNRSPGPAVVATMTVSLS
jgi:hypothetical protein